MRAALRRACPGALQLDLCDATCLEVSLGRLSSTLDPNPSPNPNPNPNPTPNPNPNPNLCQTFFENSDSGHAH